MCLRLPTDLVGAIIAWIVLPSVRFLPSVRATTGTQCLLWLLATLVVVACPACTRQAPDPVVQRSFAGRAYTRAFQTYSTFRRDQLRALVDESQAANDLPLAARIPVRQQVIDKMKRLDGDMSPYLATAYEKLGLSLVDANRRPEAIPVLRDCLRIRDYYLGADSPDSAHTVYLLSRALPVKEAEALLLGRLSAIKPNADNADARLILLSRCYDFIVHVHRQDARPYLERANELYDAETPGACEPLTKTRLRCLLAFEYVVDADMTRAEKALCEGLAAPPSGDYGRRFNAVCDIVDLLVARRQCQELQKLLAAVQAAVPQLPEQEPLLYVEVLIAERLCAGALGQPRPAKTSDESMAQSLKRCQKVTARAAQRGYALDALRRCGQQLDGQGEFALAEQCYKTAFSGSDNEIDWQSAQTEHRKELAVKRR